METLIFTLLLAAVLWWEQRCIMKQIERMNMASKDANYFIDSILKQNDIDEIIDVFTFCANTFSHWEGLIPDKTYRYHAKSIVEAYKYKIEQYKPNA